MFAISEVGSPCRARFAFSSSLRATTSVPSSRVTLTFGWNVNASSPLGPFSLMVWSSILTSTPFGTVTGSLPIRLISALPYLPDICEDFLAQTLALGFAAGHDTRRGRHDRDPKTAEHARHLGLARVDAQPGLADAAQAGHRRRLAADVLHLQHELASRRLVIRGDEALLLEDARDLDLGAAGRDRHALMARARGVAHARQQIRHRIVRHGNDARTRLARRRDALGRRGRSLAGALALDRG